MTKGSRDVSGLSPSGLRELIASTLDLPVEEIADDADLFGLGLDSLRLIRLRNRLRRKGIRVSFGKLAANPRLVDWVPLLADAAGRTDDSQPVEVDPDAPFALTPVQHAYWVGRRTDQVLGGVGCHVYFEFDGHGPRPDAVERAVFALVRRHGMLRARFAEDGTQRIAPTSPWPGLTVHDLSTVDDREAALTEIRDAASHRLLDVANGEVFDAALSLLPDGATRLHFQLDLLVGDVASLQVLFADLAEFLATQANPDDVSPPACTFPAYLATREGHAAEGRAAAEAYWRDRLADLPPPPALPLARRPEDIGLPRFTRRATVLSDEQWAALTEAARRHGLTPAMVLATAYAEVLAAWSEQRRFLLNLPLFDRRDLHPDVDQVVADFTGIVLLDVDLNGDATFAERAAAVSATFREAVSHADYSGVDVLRDLGRRRGAATGHAPVVFTSTLGTKLVDDTVADRVGRLGYMISQTPQVWLDHQVFEHHPDGVLLAWDAVDGLFRDGVLDAMFVAYQRLLDWLIEGDWSAPMPDLLPVGQRVVRERVNATGVGLPPERLHDRFFALASECPQWTALVDGETEWTYGELADAALRVAGWLAAQGVSPGDTVAVRLPKSAEQIAAVLGVLAAGGVYVPIGVDQPDARRRRIESLAGVRLTITESVTAEPLRAPVVVDPDDSAYVIFTSGSTGEPKGVEVSHRAAWNTIADVNERWHVGPDDRVLAVSALDFDLSVYDVFGLLSVGGALVLVSEDERRDAARWVELVASHDVTIWNTVPALLDMLLTAGTSEQLDSLRLALVSGDWVGLDLAPRLDAALIALGGATEAGIWSNAFEVREIPAEWSSIPYGFPLRDQRFRVCDTDGRDRPDWVPGELWIGGASLASGYRGDPETTAAKFVWHNGERWYRTGDLGRYWPDGTLEFLGRTDHQVKIRGHRIELGEIDAALSTAPGVTTAVTVVTSTRRLVAAIVGEAADALRHAREHLPEYMVPDQVHVVDSIPLSSNGKVDRPALAALLVEDVTEHVAQAPEGAVEQLVARVWADVLAPGRAVDRTADFFVEGGDSLAATRLVARLRAEGVTGASIGVLFERPVLADFAARLVLSDASESTGAIVADPAARHEPFPLTDVQRAYWLGRDPSLPLGGIGTNYYLEFELPEVDIARLEHAWNRVVRRHDMLRAIVSEDGTQRVLADVPWLHIACDEVADAEAAGALLAETCARPPFDIADWPIHRLRVARYPGGARIGLCVDYVVLDGLSVLIVLRELAACYSDESAELPPIDLTFRDYLLCQAEPRPVSTVDELPPAPALPLAVDPEAVTEPTFTRRQVLLDQKRWHAFTERARAEGVTPSAALLSAYSHVLSAWSGQSGVTVNLTLFDRPEVHPHIDRVLGDFTSLLLVACETEPDDDGASRARRVQARLADALECRDVSAIEVQRERTRRTGARDAVVPVVFTSTLGIGGLGTELGELVGGLSQTPQVWLDHQVLERPDGVLLSWDAVEDLFHDGVLDAMFVAYQGILRHLCDGDWSSPLPDPLPADQRAVRDRVSDTGVEVPSQRLHDGFFALASECPQWTALVNGETRWTYGELADTALRVAGWLVTKGMSAGDTVAVRLPKSPEQIAAVLGVLAAGGVYVPIGVDQPDARAERMAARAGITHVLDADHIAEAMVAEPLRAPVVVDPGAPAYVIFTSGSTGEPKGVEVSHRAAWNTIADVNERWHVGRGDRVLAVSALDFDLSVYDVFGLLSVGGALVLVGEHERRDAARWADLVASHDVTIWNTVPALLDMLLTAGSSEQLDGLRLALVSGDWVGLDLAPRLAETSSGGTLIALGGATEAGIWSNFCAVPTVVPPEWSSIPYGAPLARQRYRVVDPSGRDCPDWVPGELWIGGASLASGYRGDPETTAAKFVWHNGERWYRTGDLGRYWPDGTLEFLGRTDHQVKIRGHRIELGEIDSAVEAHPGIRHAVTTVHGTRLATAVVPAHDPVDLPTASAAPEGDPQEIALTVALMRRLLDETVVAQEFHDVRDRWADFVARHGGTVPPVDTRHAEVIERILHRLPAILRGDTSPLTLLDDPVLAPDAQFANHPAAAVALDAVAADIPAGLRVAELGARGGHTARRVLDVLPDGTEYTLLDSSAAMLTSARDRLGDRVDYRHLPGDALPEDLWQAFDVVIAAGALHRYPDPTHGATLAAALLTPGGRLYTIEHTAPPVLPSIVVDLLRHNESEPLDADAWIAVLAAAGLRASAHGTSIVTLTAEQAEVLDLRTWTAGRLPAHMLPDRYVLLPALPLTANGKVDRKTVHGLLDTPDVSTESEQPADGVERIVADLLAELLGVPVVDRRADFFALGGDSLTATRLITRLAEAGVAGATIGELFARPVLADFAATLTVGTAGKYELTVVADPERRHEPFPLTEVQRAYWVGRQDGFTLGGVSARCFFELDGEDLDIARLERACDTLIARHPMLRAVIENDGTQRILAEVPATRIPVATAAGAHEASAILRAELADRTIDLSRWPLFEVHAVRYPGGVRLGLSMENIVLDGLSMLIVFAELARLYREPEAELPAVGVSFRDTVTGLRGAPDAEPARRYWLERIPELPPAPRLPLARDPSTVGRPRFTRRETRLSVEEWQSLRERARSHGLTPSMVLLTAYAEVLSAWSGGDALTVNLTLFDRPAAHPDIDHILGDFTSLLLVPHEPVAGESWLDSARRVQARMAAALEHRAASAVWVQREIARAGGPSDGAMPVVFTSALGVNDGLLADLPDEFPRIVDGLSQTAQVWLDHQVMEYAGELLLTWDAVEELFPDGVLDAMFVAYQGILRHLCDEDWSEPLPDLVPDDQRAVRREVNATEAPESGRLLHEAFFAADPERVALRWSGGQMSYGELAEAALRVAGWLTERFCGVGEPVAVRLPKGPDQVVAVLGILAAGAVYVPVGVDAPRARREKIYASAGVRFELDDLAPSATAEPLPHPVPQPPDATAYVIFTSGSTGEPKGVEVSHRAAINTIEDIDERFGVGPDDRVLAVSALDFDLSVYDIFGLLSVGGTVVLVTEDERRDVTCWLELVTTHDVTIWNSVPALLDLLLGAGTVPASLRLALVSGDWVGLDLPGRLAEAAPDATLVALGGATEAAIWSNAVEVDEVPAEWSSIPYGFPLRNQCYRVVDVRGRDCPDWVSGELWIGGVGLAKGYRGDEATTVDRFTHRDGARWYRTGDLGRYWPDGTLEFLGRADHQVKIRGHRIELGEIQAALDAHPDVESAMAVATGERTRRRLHAFLLTRTGELPDLTESLRDRLPDYAIPSGYTVLTEFPLTANGKVDRAALCRLADGVRPDQPAEPPRGPVETRLAELWADALDVPAVARSDEFLLLGGDSLLAMRVLADVRTEYGVRPPLRALLAGATLAEFAAEVIRHESENDEEGVV
ncbi:amino acid adenylation domain-containing protein [Herbihabitans rhizosphaerae]|uniref:Phenyloxazoline synthase MbtB n=1 Tax=Herbihabitans rhizosphaerae TaxID=1872711 RepID=A0A4Q7L6N9_9PSEU|nr:non-ribosomal peptide synthetase [Herbihabitans rhizosphaerae]RZS45025.1 amino acid adenylation domain-containing protein [Herbihabitans rhizosphaerae]